VKSLALALAALSFAGLAAAQGMAEGKWWKRPRVAQELALTADQSAALEKIFARSKPKLIDLRANLEKKQFEYDQAMQADPVDRKQVEASIEAREQARAALQTELSLMELDMKQVLDSGQREKLVRMRENARQMMQQRRRRLRDEPLDAETDRPPAAKRNRPSPSP
jgi:Spy/CpxP family protein refolding chaperone